MFSSSSIKMIIAYGKAMQNAQNWSFVLGINKPKVNKNSKYLVPVERRRIADSNGVFGLNVGQDLLLLQSTQLVRILLKFTCSMLIPLCYLGHIRPSQNLLPKTFSPRQSFLSYFIKYIHYNTFWQVQSVFSKPFK